MSSGWVALRLGVEQQNFTNSGQQTSSRLELCWVASRWDLFGSRQDGLRFECCHS